MFYKALWMTDLLSPSPTFCTLVSLGPTSFLRGIIHFWYHQCAILVIKSWQLACLEVGWGFVFLASCSSLSQEKGIIPWTLLFPRCYVLTNSRINEEVAYMCPALQLHLGPPESQASKAREGASRFQLLVTISLKSFSWSPRRHRTDINCSIGRSLRLFPAEPMCTTHVQVVLCYYLLIYLCPLKPTWLPNYLILLQKTLWKF